jgi:NADH dehydrogenase
MPKLLILGAGYGGLAVAQKLDSLTGGRGTWQTTLVDQHDYHLVQIRVHEVAANSIPATKVKIPFEELLRHSNINFTQAYVTKIDPQAKQVETSTGVFSYDKLVISLGSETTFRNIPGLQENAFPMKTLADAVNFRNAIIRAFKLATAEGQAPLQTDDPRLTFIIGGAGLTGTELAAELRDFCQDAVKRYRAAAGKWKIFLLDGADRILLQLTPTNSEYVRADLSRKGISILTKAFVDHVEPGVLYLKDGRSLKGAVICWAGGIKAPAILAESGFEVGKEGRLEVDQYLRCKQFPDVYALGDIALIADSRNNHLIPQTGQYAENQGDYLGEAFYDLARGFQAQPYRPFSLGVAVSLGRSEALALSGPLKLVGIPGRLAKNVSYDKYEWSIRTKASFLKDLA